jgi:hypothetical protein
MRMAARMSTVLAFHCKMRRITGFPLRFYSGVWNWSASRDLEIAER